MKIRIRDNSVRLRLARGEVDALRDQGWVTATTAFPGGQEFEYSVISATDCGTPDASFGGGKMVITLPTAVVADWADSAEVSIAGEQSLADGAALKILVEKDFACLAPREGEDDADSFPHPAAATGGSC